MDLVIALVHSINEYMSDQSQGDRQRNERQAIKKEKDRLKQKFAKFKSCEQDLKQKITEFEEVFNVLSELTQTYD